jgi:competence protein ComEC
VEKVHVAAEAMGAHIATVDPSHLDIPYGDVPGVKLTAVVPSHWPDECGTDPNACSIGLRIDYCKSSVLFTGDMPAVEESLVDTHGPATLLQVAHHGSDTSSSASFLGKVQPKYAVISAGKPASPLNAEYCHPRKSTIDRLDQALGGAGAVTLDAYEGTCKNGAGEWKQVRTNDRLFATERDGDVTLMTTGDGHFKRE